MGTILLLGAGSAVVAPPQAVAVIGPLGYGFGVAGFAALVVLVLFVLRLRRTWPFEALQEPVSIRRQRVLHYAAIASAGLGTGVYAGLLHHLTSGSRLSSGFHYGTAIGILGFLPLAMLVIVFTTDSFRVAATSLGTLLLFIELGTQFGLHYVKGEFGWWDDITATNSGFLVGGLVFAAVVRVIRSLRSQR